MRLLQGYGLLPQNSGDTMRRFEQGTSKTKVYHNTVSSPCKVKAQTDVLEVCLHSSMFLPNIEEFFVSINLRIL